MNIIAKSQKKFDIDTFIHPRLTSNEMQYGAKLGFDTWVDTSCSGKHAYVESFVDGKYATATGFTPALGKMSSLPIANVLYAHDHVDGSVIILENFNTIYLGKDMNDSLVNPIQAEEADVRVDLRPMKFYKDKECQQIRFGDGTVIPLKHHGELPYIDIRRPTAHEIDTCRRLSLTSADDWNPHQ